MIYFDVTKTGTATPRSGLTRVSSRLRTGLGEDATTVAWDSAARRFAPALRPPSQAGDWFLTTELFSEDERPAFTAFLRQYAGGRAAVFHDAIPLKHPHTTWPQSVARHPGYLKLLAEFDRLWAVSAASRDELLGFWRWLGIATPPPVEVLPLGADFDGGARQAAALTPEPLLLCLGILEPRKNQGFLLEVCTELWREGLAFELHLVGRVNPHFGRPIASQVKAARREFPRALHFHAGASDAAVAALFTRARATVFPTLAEGCGLPLLESLWRGVPCVCSDLPVLRENADGGGCVPLPAGDRAAWKAGLRRLLTDDTFHRSLATAAATRSLPTWAEAAARLRAGLASDPAPRRTVTLSSPA